MAHETQLLWLTLASVIGLVVLIARFRLNAFVALLCASVFVGVASGTALPAVGKAIADGVGGVLGSIAVIIGLGTIGGKLLAESGGAEMVADTLLNWLGEQRVHWTMMLIGLLVGMGVWFSVGLVLLIPIAFAIAVKSRASMLLPGIPMVAALSIMHGLVPPHPGPMVAIEMLGADAGKTILYALLMGVPTAVVAGPVFGKFMAGRMRIEPGGLAAQLTRKAAPVRPPGFALTVFTIMLPVLLMLGGTLLDVTVDQLHRRQQWASDGGHAWYFQVLAGLNHVRPCTAFLATPVVAMLLALLFAFYSLGFSRGFDRHRLATFSEECLAPVASVLLVVGAGGGFSKVLDVCGVGKALGGLAAGLELSPLWLGWMVAALIRVAVGSATVAISAAAGIVAPIAAATPGTNLELLVIAMGAGSLILSHVNDGGFWFVKEYLNLSVAQTLKTWTVVETIIALMGLGGVLALDLFL